MKKLLVTGAGALLGQGMLRCLQPFRSKYTIYTADPSPLSSGHWLGDKAFQLPFADSPDYVPVLETIISQTDVDIILVGTDVELPIFAQKQEYLERTYNLKVVVSNEKVIEIADDKYKTAQFLKQHGFYYPDSVMANDIEAVSSFQKRNAFPYFAKPVDGARSKGLVVIKNTKELEEVIANPGNLVIQEFLPEDDGEFTTGVIVTQGVCNAVISLKRDLRDGNTYRTYRDNTTSRFDDYIKKVAEKLQVEGPCNFQFRIKDNTPVIFEINARFSGTTPIRSFYGFNEVEEYITYLTDGIDIKQPSLKDGTVFRTFSDLFIENEEITQVFESTKTTPKSIYHPFKL